MKPIKIGLYCGRPISVFYAGKNFMIKVLQELPAAFDRRRGVGYKRYLIEVKRQQRILLYSLKYNQWYIEKLPEKKEAEGKRRHCCKDLQKNVVK